VDWLSIDAHDQSGSGDAEERRRHGGVADRSHGGDAEAWWVGVTTTTWRHSGSDRGDDLEARQRHGDTAGRSHNDNTVDQRRGNNVEVRQVASGGDLEVHSVWTLAVFDFKPLLWVWFSKNGKPARYHDLVTPASMIRAHTGIGHLVPGSV
jgi:hypothetical protein